MSHSVISVLVSRKWYILICQFFIKDHRSWPTFIFILFFTFEAPDLCHFQKMDLISNVQILLKKKRLSLKYVRIRVRLLVTYIRKLFWVYICFFLNPALLVTSSEQEGRYHHRQRSSRLISGGNMSITAAEFILNKMALAESKRSVVLWNWVTFGHQACDQRL